MKRDEVKRVQGSRVSATFASSVLLPAILTLAHCGSADREYPHGRVGGGAGSGGANNGASGASGLARAGSTAAFPGQHSGGSGPATSSGSSVSSGSCNSEGKIECVATEQKLRRVCQGGQWQAASTCAADQNCDRTTGACALIIAGCEDRGAGFRFCDSMGRAATCGADLVRVETETCSARCESGQCAPAGCGDGIVSAPEECDDGNTVNTDRCTNACHLSKCGDGFQQSGEECDDGNSVDTDSCSSSCKATRCGDGIVQAGESCDDGNRVDADSCSNACKSAACGDRIVQNGEECDDGNATDNDGCSNACKIPKCGDKIVQVDEACDDGNAVDNDACTNQCKVPGCGDNIKQSGEECDDGNSVNTDNCTSACKAPRCGDSFKQNGEECDDGNTLDSDDCTNACKKARCGDNIKNPSAEECDDGNTINDDDCSNTCKKARCGDGILQGTSSAGKEECDDGNAKINDKCSNKCTINQPLSEYQSGCTAVSKARDGACVAAVHRYCKKMGGFAGGITQETNSTTVAFGVGCFASGSNDQDVQVTELTKLVSDCSKADLAQSPACILAAHKWCKNNKKLDLGFVQEVNKSDPDKPFFTVACSPGASVTLDLAQLASYVDGNCKDVQTTIAQSCVSAAHRFCEKSRGKQGGMIQDVTDTNKMLITCFDFASYGDAPL